MPSSPTPESLTVANAPPSKSPPQSSSSIDDLKNHVNSQDATVQSASSSGGLPPTSDEIVVSDSAVLDEEEQPGQDNKGHDVARNTYAVGSGGYNALKSFNGQVYTGMAVGGSHTWNYDPGIWKETKEEPDLWKIDYETTKRRDKNAPEGSGAPVGIEYHWLIVAHQYVKKVDANTYETHLIGSKYKLAHKGPTANSWSIPTVKAQRVRELELLDDAKRRVEGLPPVVAAEKVKVERHERGQQKLDNLFTKAAESKTENRIGTKRKMEEQGGTSKRTRTTDARDEDKENR